MSSSTTNETTPEKTPETTPERTPEVLGDKSNGVWQQTPRREKE